jgi:putative hydrolase of the HAD superfamily
VTGYDAVLFDLDGTICHRTQDTPAMYAAAFDRAGERPFAEPADLWAELDGPPDHDDWIGYIGAGFARLAAQHGRTDADPLALAEALAEAVDHSAVDPTPGAERAIEAAADLGPVGIVTNGPERRQRPKLEALGVLDRFDVVVYGGDLPRSKPHSLPFDRALSDLDCPRDRVLYVGNSLDYDVAGAQNAGLAAAWIRGDDDEGQYDPDHTLASLAELPEILRGER